MTKREWVGWLKLNKDVLEKFMLTSAQTYVLLNVHKCKTCNDGKLYFPIATPDGKIIEFNSATINGLIARKMLIADRSPFGVNFVCLTDNGLKLLGEFFAEVDLNNK